MTSDNFIFWLSGYFELNPNAKSLNSQQTQILKDKLQQVNVNITDNKPTDQFFSTQYTNCTF